MSNDVSIVVAERCDGVPAVLYVGDCRGAAACIVLQQKFFCDSVFIRAAWLRISSSGEAAVVWVWAKPKPKTNICS